MNHIKLVETILYVENQQTSTDFYSKLFKQQPNLNVPGMTEFVFSDFFKLGIMPNNGIAKILLNNTPHPSLANGIPKCELYFVVDNIEDEFELEPTNTITTKTGRVAYKANCPVCNQDMAEFLPPSPPTAPVLVPHPPQNS